MLIARYKVSVAIAIALVSLAVAVASAQAASPKLTVVGLKSFNLPEGTLPLTEVGDLAELDVAYKGKLPAGAKMKLLVKKNSEAPFEPSSEAVKLAGGHAKVKVSEHGIGGPIEYKVELIQGKAVLSASKPVTVVWASEPAGVYVFGPDDSESAYTSSQKGGQSCSAGCSNTSGAGVGGYAEAKSGTGPVAPGWTVKLLYDGQVVCQAENVEAACHGPVTYPSSESNYTATLTAELIGPHGQRVVATMNTLVYA
jgi:hypothetical protein